MAWFQSCILGIIFYASLAGLALNAAAQNNAGTEPGAGAYPRAVTSAGGANGAFTVDAAAGMPGAAIPLNVRLPAPYNSGAVSKAAYTFLMFKGIPDGFSLTSGFQTRSTWIVSISDSRDLKMTVPQAFQGAFNAEVYLYRGENTAPARCTFYVRIFTSADTLPTSAGYAAVPSDVEKQAATALSGDKAQLSREEEAEMFAQGEAHLRNGNVVFARLLFEELVSHGNVRGLFALARTYDPAVLRQLGAVGLQGDAEKARELYRKATEFAGSPPPE